MDDAALGSGLGPPPLDGLFVLDLTRVLAGPICGRALSDLGARVVKIEPPAGDLTRFAVPRHGPVSGYFAQQNAGKENVSVDLDHDEGRRLLFALASRADIIIENFRPGVCDRLGVGYAAVSAANPGVVYGSLSGYGQTGPWSGRRSYAVVSHASSGLTYGTLAHQEMVAGRSILANESYSHGDVYTGLMTLAGVLAALHARSVTGKGQHVDVAMLDTMLFVNEHANEELAAETSREASGLGSAWSPVVETANGDRVSVAGDPGAIAYTQFLRLLGRADEIETFRPHAVREQRGPELRADFREFASLVPTGEALVALLEEVGLASDVVRSVPDVAASEHAKLRGSIIEIDDSVGGTFAIPQSPWRFSGARSGVAGGAAWRGQHNRTALRDLLGLDDAELDRLEDSGVLSSRPPRH